jgi:hypothetical protein
MNRTLLAALLAGLVVVFFSAADASAMYNPATGSFLNRDPGPISPTRSMGMPTYNTGDQFLQRDTPAQYTAGMDLYEYVKSQPTLFIDPFGNYMVGTGVYICNGYTKGSLVWGNYPAHTYVRINGTGYGLYAQSHLSNRQGNGSCKCSGDYKAVWDKAVLKDDDSSVYPERDPTNLPDGSNYAVCTEIRVDNTFYDPSKVKDEVLSRAKAGQDTYSLPLSNCNTFADRVIGQGISASQRPYPLKQSWGEIFTDILFGE